jgi:opacity protein-like surface antigen
MKKQYGMMAILALLALSGGARAAEEEWTFKITPYLWGAGVNGDIGTSTLKVPFDVDPLDALKDLEFVAMVAAEANHGPWSLLTDASFLSLEDEVDTSYGEVSADLEQWLLQGSLLYNVYNIEDAAVDLGLGFRYFSVDMTVDVPSSRADANPSDGWTDPILVARVRQQFTEKLFGVLYGDLGGFGAASDLTWQLMAGAGYTLTEQVSALLAYRYLDYDYDQKGFVYSAAQSGLAVGLQFNW